MPSIGSSLLPASALVTTPNVFNLSMPLANTEYTLTLPTGTRKFTFRARNSGKLQIADTLGLSGTTYFTLYPGEPYNCESVTGSSTINLYLRSSKASEILEVLYWT